MRHLAATLAALLLAATLAGAELPRRTRRDDELETTTLTERS